MDWTQICVSNLKIEIACYAIKEEIWGEADKLLSGILEENLTQKGYQAFADIAGSQNKPDKVKDFLKKEYKDLNTKDYSYFDAYTVFPTMLCVYM